jgi:hypothetical protein
MTLNERILDFMDGSLAPDDEAELLHRLSVSPEKRDLLRSFMNQKALFARDRQSIAVPYEAEQALWQHLGAVMPEAAAPAMMESARTVPVPLFSRIFSTASASVGAITLLIGLGVGYFVGAHQSQPANIVEMTRNIGVRPTIPPQMPVRNIANPEHGNSNNRLSARSVTERTAGSITFPVLFNRSAPMVNIGGSAPLAIETDNTNQATQTGDPAIASIASIEGRNDGPVKLNEIGGDGGGIRPMLQHNQASGEVQKSFLQRFEFSINESFGRQFPNSTATNVSLPLITNSSIEAFFQLLPHSSLLWVGASYGTANITRKDLFTRVGDPTDPLQTVLGSDTTHAQTSYLASFIQCRVPAFASADITFTAGYGWANLGQMMMGELGLHYDVSREVGIQFGLRVLRFNYDLTAEKDAAIKSGTGSLVVPNGVDNASPSFNTELNTGLYFHF